MPSAQNTKEAPISTDNDLLGDLLDLDGIDNTTPEAVPGPSQMTSTPPVTGIY